jgi:hypothetical protein
VYPSSCNRVTTPPQLDPSAQAPCSSTMAGLAAALDWLLVALDWLPVEAAATVGIAARAATATPVRRGCTR